MKPLGYYRARLQQLADRPLTVGDVIHAAVLAAAVLCVWMMK